LFDNDLNFGEALRRCQNLIQLKALLAMKMSVIKLISKNNRLEILLLMRCGYNTAQDFMSILGLGQSNVSQILTELVDMGVVQFERTQENKKMYKIKNNDVIVITDKISDVYGIELTS